MPSSTHQKTLPYRCESPNTLILSRYRYTTQGRLFLKSSKQIFSSRFIELPLLNPQQRKGGDLVLPSAKKLYRDMVGIFGWSHLKGMARRFLWNFLLL